MHLFAVLLCSFASISWAASGPQASDRILIKQILGSESVKVIKKKVEKKLKAGEELALGDEIITEAKQIAVLQGYDGSQWKVAPNSSLKLEKLNPDKNNYSYWVFQMAKGSLWGKVQPAADKEGYRLKLKTKNAAMGIRGTEYLVADNELQAELDVLEGKVWWGTSDNFEPGTFTEVKAGEHAEIKGKERSAPVPTKEKGNALLELYHLFWDEKEHQAEETGTTPRSCRDKGMGWRMKDGKPECFVQTKDDVD